jgi:FlaA1/EpsC-like NDP-sugar epimerase
VREVFQSYGPQIVFHAAAYKHVPMMEFNAGEAVKVNIFGTYNLVRTAVQSGVEKFIMISTDKAVRPTSVMGATKRVAEYICRAYNEKSEVVRWEGGEREDGRQRTEIRHQRAEPGNGTAAGASTLDQNNGAGLRKYTRPETSGTKFISVRFGNVLGSRGSVLPLFLDQLKHGGPLTVTHKDMRRYFMTIPEAVSLVLQASVIGQGGEVLVLDMGEPVNIAEMAEELVRMHGLEPGKDVDIQFTGLRAGEKLFEEILTAEEGTDASKHQKIYVARNSDRHSTEEIQVMLDEFGTLLRGHAPGNDGVVKALLRKYVKHYDESPKAGDGDRRSEIEDRQDSAHSPPRD